jgi:hypothetical protein
MTTEFASAQPHDAGKVRSRPDILDAVVEAYQYELYGQVNADALHVPLAGRRRGRAYSREEITAALELLGVPQLGILRRVGDSRFVLQMPKETLTRRLRALVAVLVAPADGASAGDRGQSFFGEP